MSKKKCAIAKDGSEISNRIAEKWPHARLWDRRARLYRTLPFEYENVVHASDWLDENEKPIQEAALLQKVEAEIQADNELVVLISKGAAGQLYRWMVSTGLIEETEV